MGIELIVFDIAGTTLQDDEDVVASNFVAALAKFGVNYQNGDLNKVMGYRKIDAIKMILDAEKIDMTEADIESIHQEFLHLINEHYKTASITEIEGASEVFDALKSKGIQIAINTGFSRSTTDIIIDRMGWKEKGLVDDSITSDEVEHGRPEADMINMLMKRLSITDAKNVVKVGDTPSDLMEGENAGCGLTIGVLYGTHSRDELMDFHHDYLIDDIKDLTSIILGQ